MHVKESYISSLNSKVSSHFIFVLNSILVILIDICFVFILFELIFFSISFIDIMLVRH